MTLRKIFSFLRATSTILAVASILSLGYEIVSVPGHGLTHAVQKTHLQQESAANQITTDHCDLCRAFSFLTGNETFFPKLDSFSPASIAVTIALTELVALSPCILPPSRAPPSA